MVADRLRDRSRRVALSLALAGTACGRSATSEPPCEVIAAPAVEFVGCAEVLADGRCVVRAEASEIRLWLDLADFARVEVRVDGRPVEAERRTVAGGVQLRLPLPPSATTLSVHGVEPAWTEAWSLRVAHRGDVDREGLAQLDRRKADAHLRGDFEQAALLAGQLATLAAEMGRQRTAARAAHTAAHLYLYELRDLDHALPFVEQLGRAAPHLAEARIWSGLVRGVMARHLGDVTTAIDSFAGAAALAERLGMHEELSAAREGLSLGYGELGRTAEATALASLVLQDGRDTALSCPLRYAALSTGGWVQLLLAQQRRPFTRPDDFFMEALSLVERHGACPSWDDEVNARINLALSALTDDMPAMALAWLEPVDVAPAAYRTWVDNVRAEAGVRLDRTELLPNAMARPSAALPLAERYNHWMVLAAAHEHLGMRAAAVDSYAEAEAIVDDEVASIAHDLGREVFVSGRQRSAAGLVRNLILEGRAEEAMCRARRARGRALRLLDRTARLQAAEPQARARWRTALSDVARLQRELDADAARDDEFSDSENRLRHHARARKRRAAARRLDEAYERLGGTAAPYDCAHAASERGDETSVLVFPLGAQWAVFVRAGEEVHANLVEPLEAGADPRSWTERAFAGAEALIDGARLLRLLPMAQSWAVDWHALPWRGGKLIDAAPVAYALDLPAGPRVAPRPARAFVVADPADDLPGARREADAVADTLAARAWTVDRIAGDGATRDAFVAGVSAASVLHYAGHGEHAGHAGWDARLRIGAGDGVGIADILALPAVPRGVVLSGCETGRTSRATLGGGMSLARAFVLSGSDWVIAADRPVSDALAFAVGVALHETSPRLTDDPFTALQRVQRRMAADYPDWAAFRVVTR
ncbi:MAG: CHAT domain-containing protein [Myxococcota bacterium]